MEIQKNRLNPEGEKNGFWEYYHHYGVIHCSGHYINGLRHGTWTVFWKSGEVREKRNYDNGGLIGLVQEIKVSGEITFESIYIR